MNWAQPTNNGAFASSKNAPCDATQAGCNTALPITDSNYGVWGSGGNRWVNSWKGAIRLADILDGTTNTVLIGEKHIALNNPFGSANGDGSIYETNTVHWTRRCMATMSPTINIPLLAPSINIPGVSFFAFGGKHPGVCQFVLCDGSVRPLRITTSINILDSLANRKDGKAIPAGY